ncbi:MAG: 50S ribosomal protein L10 [Candidatus Omnitrophica bacterium]|nr:50S ribosomal protein L10 [Candidatus Omnitrophota bacterium]
MKKIGLLTREKISQEIKDGLSKSEACVFISFKKTKAFPVNKVRNSLKTAHAKLFVAKNTLLAKAFKEANDQDVSSLIEGETGIVFAYDKDVVGACKVLVDFSKENETLKLRGGFLKDKKMTADQLQELVKLPPKEVLVGMVVNGFAAPLTGFMATLNQVVVQLLWTLEEIKKKKEK